MLQEKWTAVDDYFETHFIDHDPVLAEALSASETAGLPAINVAPNQGKLLMLMAQMQGAKSILEIGTLGGYSTIWLGRALPDDGRLISLEMNSDCVTIARGNIARAGLDDKVTIIEGVALDSLPTLVRDAPFDFIFIDADKPNNPPYFEWAMKLSRSGTIIIIDNVVRDGEVANLNSTDEKVQGVQQVTELIANDVRVSATALQSVGSKGYDGFALLCVL